MEYEKMETVGISIKDLNQFLYDYASFRTSRRHCIHTHPKTPNVAVSKFFMEEIYDESVDRHRSFANKLSEQTPFQRWISKDSRFQDSLNKIFNSKLSAFLWVLTN